MLRKIEWSETGEGKWSERESGGESEGERGEWERRRESVNEKEEMSDREGE